MPAIVRFYGSHNGAVEINQLNKKQARHDGQTTAEGGIKTNNRIVGERATQGNPPTQ